MSKTENTLSKTESSLSKCDVFVELQFNVAYMCNKVKMGNTLQQYKQVVGMHSIYLVVKEFRGYFKGKFWCSVVLLFHLQAIYLPIMKCLVQMYEIWQINCFRLTQIYLYRWYILDFIRLTNDIETNPSPAVVIQVQIYLAV